MVRYLGSNKISKIEGLSKLHDLAILSLTNNQITSVDKEDLDGLTEVDRVCELSLSLTVCTWFVSFGLLIWIEIKLSMLTVYSRVLPSSNFVCVYICFGVSCYKLPLQNFGFVV